MRNLKYFFVIFIATIAQISIVEQFINASFYVHVPLLIVIFYNWLFPNNTSLFVTILMGWAISYFDALAFGVTIALFILTAIFVQRLTEKWMTNRTTGSLIITGILATLFYDSLLILLSFTQFGLPFDFLRTYILTISVILIQMLSSAIFLLLCKSLLFRYEVFKAQS